jgi:hypothetical protein
MRVIKISTCCDCPFFKYSGYTSICGHRKIFDMEVRMSEIHKDCPLDTPETAGFVETSAQNSTTKS